MARHGTYAAQPIQCSTAKCLQTNLVRISIRYAAVATKNIRTLAISHARIVTYIQHFHGLNSSTPWWIMPLIGVEHKLKSLSTQNMDILNNSCDVVCLKCKLSYQKNQLALITIHFFEESAQLHQMRELRISQGTVVTCDRCDRKVHRHT